MLPCHTAHGLQVIAAEPTGRNNAADVAASKAAGALVEVRAAGAAGRLRC